MVAQRDPELTGNRWQSTQAEWDGVELWEKVEVRLRRRRRLWIAAALGVFLLLSTVPVWMDRNPKWQGLRVIRRLAQLVVRTKTRAIQEKMAFRVVVQSDPNLVAVVERIKTCAEQSGEQVEQFADWGLDAEALASFSFVTSEFAQKLDLPGLRTQICFDPLVGESTTGDFKAPGIGIAPRADLGESRLDRMAVLFWKGPSAELFFE